MCLTECNIPFSKDDKTIFSRTFFLMLKYIFFASHSSFVDSVFLFFGDEQQNKCILPYFVYVSQKCESGKMRPTVIQGTLDV